MNNRVDFIGIGAQKSATTWIFRVLEEHPDIRCNSGPDNKELNFFNHNFEKGYQYYHSGFEFGQWKTGEYSTLYFYDEAVPRRIHEYNPDVKLIVSFRNPVERAYSQHLHQIKEGHVPPRLYQFFDAAMHNPSYLEIGKYASHLERYLEFFDLSKIHVILFDDIDSRPEFVIKELYRFIGVDSDFLPESAHKKVYSSHTYKSRGLEGFLNTSSEIVKRIFGDSLHRAITWTNIPNMIRSYNKTQFDGKNVPTLTKEERWKLYDTFESEIERLNNMIGRDLTIWKEDLENKEMVINDRSS